MAAAAGAGADKKKKKKKGAKQELQFLPGSHTDAILALSWNPIHRYVSLTHVRMQPMANGLT